MNRGRIDKAEALLQQARVLDPDNPTIQADLDRARRIQASVRPRS
jgi:Flp pilus assembly protein TadD